MATTRAHNFIDRIGQVFGRLVVIQLDKVEGSGIIYWLCKCECGNVISTRSNHLISGGTKSCGCLAKDINAILNRKFHRTHGMTKTRFYRVWKGMKERCLKPYSISYSNYGGRGITVCDRWLESFNNFKEDMYESYLKHIEKFGESNTSINRKEVNGNYEPSNCEWSTREEQGKNLRTSSKTENHKEHLYWKSKLQVLLNDILTKNIYHSNLFEKYIGCTVIEFKQHIESHFLPRMTWENHGHGFGKWEFDHILGCNNFDLSREEDRLICFNYKNTQPLWWEDHAKKSTLRVD